MSMRKKGTPGEQPRLPRKKRHMHEMPKDRRPVAQKCKSRIRFSICPLKHRTSSVRIIQSIFLEVKTKFKHKPSCCIKNFICLYIIT